MNEIPNLDRNIAAGKTQIRYDDRRAWMSSPNEAFDAGPDGFIEAIDVAQVYHELQRIWRHTPSFTTRHMAMASGIAPTTLDNWNRHSVIATTTPGVRGKKKRYPFAAFVGVFVLAALRRHGAGLSVCRAVYALIATDGTTNEIQQAAQIESTVSNSQGST